MRSFMIRSRKSFRFPALALTILASWAEPAAAATFAGPPVQPFAQWGRETLAQIDKDFWQPGSRLYADTANFKKPADRKGSRHPAFMWGCGVQLTALAAAARIDRIAYGTRLNTYAAELEKYWIVSDGIGGYNVQPGMKNSDRYYDDNAWIVLGMLEVFEVTGDRKYLDKAEQTMKFVLSGEDQVLDGGLYWQENKKESKHTCTNAPAITGLVELYQATGKKEYLDTALRLYAWTRAHLQGPNALYWDHIRVTGEINKGQLTYNTALMIRANCLLYQATQDPKYLDEARREGKAGIDRWIRPDGAVADSGRFAHLFLGSLLALAKLDPDPTWCKTIDRTLRYVHNKLKDRNGRYPNVWDRIPTAPLEKVELLDEASVARAYLEAASPFPLPKPIPAAKPGPAPNPTPTAKPNPQPTQ